jgi:hypothetical protein
MTTTNDARFMLRVPGSVIAWVKETAGQQRRSVNSQIVHLLEEAMAAGDKLGGTAPAAGNTLNIGDQHDRPRT